MIPHQNDGNPTKEESSALKKPNGMENNSSKDIESQSSFNLDLEEVKKPNIEVRSKQKTNSSPGIYLKLVIFFSFDDVKNTCHIIILVYSGFCHLSPSLNYLKIMIYAH